MSVSKQPKSIDEYVRAKRKAGCVVCEQISPELMVQIKDARRRGRVSVDVVLEWLRAEHRIKITAAQWALHARGLHDAK